MKKIVFALGIIATLGFIASGAFADQQTSKNMEKTNLKSIVQCAM